MGSVILLTSPQSFAATKTANMNVKVKVVGNCTLSAADLNFGDYNPATTADLKVDTSITAKCSNAVAYSIALSNGSSGNYQNRTFSDGNGNTLNYNLYKEAATTNIWGNTGTDVVQGTGNGNNQTLQVYGKIPAGQTTGLVGDVTDIITVTLTY